MEQNHGFNKNVCKWIGSCIKNLTPLECTIKIEAQMVKPGKFNSDLTWGNYLCFNIALRLNKTGCSLIFCLICVLVCSSLTGVLTKVAIPDIFIFTLTEQGLQSWYLRYTVEYYVNSAPQLIVLIKSQSDKKKECIFIPVNE